MQVQAPTLTPAPCERPWKRSQTIDHYKIVPLKHTCPLLISNGKVWQHHDLIYFTDIHCECRKREHKDLLYSRIWRHHFQIKRGASAPPSTLLPTPMITLNHDRVKHANLARNAASAPVNCNLNFPAESASIYLFVSVHRRARLGALRFANRPPTVCTTKSPAEIVTSVSWVVEGHGPWPLTTIPNQSSSKEPQTKFSVSNASNWKRSCYPLCNCGYCLRFAHLAVRLLCCNYPRATEDIFFWFVRLSIRLFVFVDVLSSS